MKILTVLILSCAMRVAGQDCPMHEQHMQNASQHRKEVEKHGDEAMGFPHDKTIHHFRLYSDGGAIEVTTNESSDSTNVDKIRLHLKRIAEMFSEGNFSIPMFVHDQVPPGVPVMKEQRKQINYVYEEMASGARVKIETSDAEVLKAVHEFLGFQIKDHHTGDKTDISR